MVRVPLVAVPFSVTPSVMKRRKCANLNLQQHEALLQRLIVPGAKPIISSPMHSFWLGGERVRDTEITAQALSHFFLAFKDQAVTETNLPGCIGQAIAVPTSPGVAAWSEQLQYASTASVDPPKCQRTLMTGST
jgi:hypothetical protein